jgi:putative endonuclease
VKTRPFGSKKGYRILERNFRSRLGEIDIVARDGDTIVFVEVKTRSTESFGSPKDAIDARKIRRITRGSMDYLRRNFKHGDVNINIRFDVVTVELKDSGFSTELIKDAFEAHE